MKKRKKTIFKNKFHEVKKKLLWLIKPWIQILKIRKWRTENWSGFHQGLNQGLNEFELKSKADKFGKININVTNPVKDNFKCT